MPEPTHSNVDAAILRAYYLVLMSSREEDKILCHSLEEHPVVQAELVCMGS